MYNAIRINHKTKDERKMKYEFKYYKRYLLAFAVILVTVTTCLAQIEFTEHTIADNFDMAYFYSIILGGV